MALAAPILCAGVTVYKAIKQIQGTPGQTIAIPGAGGGLGHLAVQYAKALGYRVIAIDGGDEKRQLIKGYGEGIEFVDFKQGNVVEQVKALTGGKGAHAVICVASAADAYTQALELLRPRGALVCVGLPPNAEIKASVFFTVFYQHRIIGSYVGNRSDAIEALDIAARGQVKTEYKIEPLDNLESIYDRMKALTLVGRIVLDCQ